jgi:hypothetical protein
LSKLNYIFDVVGERERPMRGFLDTETQEIVIYDDSKGKELFRIGGQGQQRTKSPSATKSKLTTLTFVICNGGKTKQTATLFASNLEPLIQPLGVSVVIKEIEKQVFNTHNYLRRDILSKKIKIVGFSYFVENSQQFTNDLQFGTIKPYGVAETMPFSPLNYISKNQTATNMMDLSKKFNWDVDARSVLYVPIEPESKVTLLFNVLEDVEEPVITEYKNTTQKRTTNFIETRPSYNANESNTIFKNINSGGLGAVNFDGGGGYTIKNSNKNEAIIGLIKLGILTTGAVLIVNALCRKN